MRAPEENKGTVVCFTLSGRGRGDLEFLREQTRSILDGHTMPKKIMFEFKACWLLDSVGYPGYMYIYIYRMLEIFSLYNVVCIGILFR